MRISRLLPALSGLVACGILAQATGCAGGRQTVAAEPARETSPEYRIGPGDTLNVFVWNHEELTVTVPVRPDGMITTPLIENLQAAGKTPSALARDMEQKLAEFVRTPKVNVIVTNAVGSYSDQIRVVGQAAQPQALPYVANMTVLDVMIKVGGLAEYAAGNRARIVRRNGERIEEIPVKLDDLLNDGRIGANVVMRPGDVLIIPESRF